MSESERTEIEKPEGHYCFACGTANPIGLNLSFYGIGDAVCTDITLEKVHEGWENMAHGGIVTTLLDEVMSWAIMYSKKVFLVTRNMKIKYIRPVMIGTPLTITGRLTDDSEPPKIRAKAEIRDAEGRLFVRSSAEFVELSKKELATVPEGMKEQMLSLFQKFE